MQYIGRVDVLKSPQYLVHKVADVICTEPLSLQELVKIGLHQCLHHIAEVRVKDTPSLAGP